MLNEKLIGEVVSIATVGGETVGRLKSIEEEGIVVSSPCSVIPSEQGGSLHPGVCMTGKTEPSEAAFYKTNIITIVESSDEVMKLWQQMTSGIILQ